MVGGIKAKDMSGLFVFQPKYVLMCVFLKTHVKTEETEWWRNKGSFVWWADKEKRQECDIGEQPRWT